MTDGLFSLLIVGAVERHDGLVPVATAGREPRPGEAAVRARVVPERRRLEAPRRAARAVAAAARRLGHRSIERPR